MARHCPNPECPGLARDGIQPEFVDSVSACVDCGGTLMQGASSNDAPEGARFNEFRTVFIAADAVQAHLVKGLIESEKIYVYLRGESLSGAVGELPATVTQIEVQVSSDDFVEAREIALQFEGRREWNREE